MWEALVEFMYVHHPSGFVAAIGVRVDYVLSGFVLFTSVCSVTALLEVPKASGIQGRIKVSTCKLPV